jgi:chorismate mutase
MEINKFIHKKPYLIAGPCSAESEHQILTIAQELDGIADVFRAGVWKPRTSPNSFEGVGNKGLSWLKSVKQQTTLKILSKGFLLVLFLKKKKYSFLPFFLQLLF